MDPELFKRMQEAAARFRSGETDAEEIMTPNGLARLVRDASNPLGFRIDFVGDGARRIVPLQEYPPSATRPPGYPAPLPFLPGCAVVVSSSDQSATWFDPAEARQAMESVARQCTNDGWVEVPRPAAGSEQPARVFEKDGAERSLRLIQDPEETRVVLRERRLAGRHPSS